MLTSQWDCRQRGFPAFVSVIAVAGLMCSATWGATSVTITKSGDVFLKDSATGKKTKFLTLRGICRNEDHYHAAEYNNGCVYVLRRIGWRGYQAEDPNYRDELWRYDKNGHGRKLWSGRGIDFRVSPDSKFIAVKSSTQSKDYPSDLYLLDFNGKLRKKFAPEGLVKGEFYFERWDGRYLWLKDQDAIDIYSFIRIDSQTLRLAKYAIPPNFLANMDYNLNTSKLVLAYSDYPVILESDGANDYEKSGSQVHLYAYDLRTKQKRLISKCITDLFNPKWIGASTLEFDSPKGAGRLRQHVSF